MARASSLKKRAPTGKSRLPQSPQEKAKLIALCKAAVAIVRSQQHQPQDPGNKRRRPHNMSPEERRISLVNDCWVKPGSVTADSVVCLGCGKTYCLDNRGLFYSGFWTKHKGRCRVIRIAEVVAQGYTEDEAIKILQQQAKARREAKRRAEYVKEAIKEATPRRRAPARKTKSSRARKTKSPTPLAANSRGSGRLTKSESPESTATKPNAPRRVLRSNSGSPFADTAKAPIGSSQVHNSLAETALTPLSTPENVHCLSTVRKKEFHLNETNETPKLKALPLPGYASKVFSPPHSPSSLTLSNTSAFLCPLSSLPTPHHSFASSRGASAYKLGAADWSDVRALRESTPFGL